MREWDGEKDIPDRQNITKHKLRACRVRRALFVSARQYERIKMKIKCVSFVFILHFFQIFPIFAVPLRKTTLSSLT